MFDERYFYVVGYIFDGENWFSDMPNYRPNVLCAGDEMYSRRAEVSRHEVADGATTYTGLSTTDSSYVHVGLCRATDSSCRPT